MLKPRAYRGSRAPKTPATPELELRDSPPSSPGGAPARSRSSTLDPLEAPANAPAPFQSATSAHTTPLPRPRRLPRSLTDLTAPGRLQRARFLFHRPDRASYNDRSAAVSTIAGCLPPGAQAPCLVDMLRSENASPLISPSQSRRQSLLVPKDGEAYKEKPPMSGGGGGCDDDDGEGSLRGTESKLRQSIMDLDAFSTDAAQTLNDTCDAMQDKMASLQEMVMALKQLAEASRDIHDGFNRASSEIEHDITRQLDALGEFTGQQDTIENLQKRIHRERRRIESLSARVEVVRQRVEGWEEADRAWQEKTRKRLTMVWTALTVIALVFVGLFVFVEYNRGDAASDSRAGMEIRNVEEIQRATSTSHAQQHDANISIPYTSEEEPALEDDSEAGVGSDSVSSFGSYSETPSHDETQDEGEKTAEPETKSPWKTTADDDGWLRAFDEL